MGRSDSAIVVGRRVSARRGPFLPLLPGQRRAQRARKYGNTVESVDEHTWKVQWDDGVVTIEKSAAMRVEVATAGFEPPAPAHHSAAASTQHHRIDASYVPFHFTESQPQWSTLGGTPGSVGTDVVPPSVVDSLYAGSLPTSNDGNFGSGSGSSAPSAGTSSYNTPVVNDPFAESSDSEGDDDDPTEHPAVAAGGDGTQLLASLVGETTVANGVTWTVISDVTDSTIAERAEKFDKPGLRDGLPVQHEDVDLLALWLLLYPGDMLEDIEKMNAAGLMKKATWRLITPREYTVFWGLMIAGTQYHQQGKNLWDQSPRRGVRDPPSFTSWMKHWRFEEIRQLLKYSKADLSKVQTDQWAWFRKAVTDFNSNRKAVLQPGLVAVLDESMSAWKPRADKLGGLPNISFVMRKPKPLGTEFKASVDADIGIMIYMEIQEGKDPMRGKEHAPELGVTSACVLRAAAAAVQPGATICGDSWFSSVKVSGLQQKEKATTFLY